MSDKYAIFLDIDGTLVDMDNFPLNITIHQKDIAAIEKARALGHYVFVNTGRAYAWIDPRILEQVKLDGVVSGAGTHVFFGGDSIYESFMNESKVKSVAKSFLKAGMNLLISGTEKNYMVNPVPDWDTSDAVLLNSESDIDNTLLNKIQKIEFFDLSLINSKNRFMPEKKEFEQLFENFETIVHSWYIESWTKDSSKSKAMLIAAEKLGIPKEHCIAIGDSGNDIDMIEAAGIGVAMGNAIPEVKQVADFVSLPCKEGGISYALSELLFNK